MPCCAVVRCLRGVVVGLRERHPPHDAVDRVHLPHMEGVHDIKRRCDEEKPERQRRLKKLIEIAIDSSSDAEPWRGKPDKVSLLDWVRDWQ